VQLTRDTRLKVVPLYGEKSLLKEQRKLVGSPLECRYFCELWPLIYLQEFSWWLFFGGYSWYGGCHFLSQFLVSTPGRLVDHISDTPGFTLQHLQFLVVDEADRLLMQSYYDWLPKVLDALHESHEGQILDNDGYVLIIFHGLNFEGRQC
jgi:ATP-dependent RNA helicase DDX51/DBP6